MIVLDPEKINRFLSQIARGFVVTPTQLLIFFLLLAGILLFLVVFAVLQRRKSKLKMSRRSEEIYRYLAGKFNLNAEEQDIVRRMAAFLNNGEREYTLFLQPHRFDACARRLSAAGQVSEEALSSLRLKLGFATRGPEEIPASSSELVQGTELVLFDRNLRSCRAVIQAQKPEALLISVDRDGERLQNGARVTVYFHSPMGLFSFSSRVMKNGQGQIYLDHSEKLLRYQRRRFYRRNVRAVVQLRPAGSMLRPVVSLLLDLGGGGASLSNPGGRFKASDRLEIVFPPAVGGLTATGRVLRTSQGDGILHLQFENISESSRDHIMGSILSRKSLELSERKTPYGMEEELPYELR